MLATAKQTAALVNIFQGGTRLTYKKGEFVIRPGETPTGVFYVETGMVKAYNISKYGEENLLSIRRATEIFPLIWVFYDDNGSVIYETLEPTTLWRMSREDFMEQLDKAPEILRPLLDLTLEMYLVHSERIVNLEYRTVRERLVSFLLTSSRRFGKKLPGKKILINVPLKQQDIASSINATRETTSRELVRLERLGLLSTHQYRITLLDVKKLRAYL